MKRYEYKNKWSLCSGEEGRELWVWGIDQISGFLDKSQKPVKNGSSNTSTVILNQK